MDRRAGSKTSDSEVLKELEAEITCLVCQGLYTDAKLLPCMHYYCKSCIEELRSKCSAGKSFPCPECREDTFLPSGRVDSLKSAFFVERLKDLFAKMSTEEGLTETPCGVCKGKSTLFCRECAIFYCSGECRSKTGHSEAHHVIGLETRYHRSGSSSVDPDPLCSEHSDHMNVYCFTCETVVCRDCIVSGHSGHRFNALKKCAVEKRREICNSLIPLHKTWADISDAEKKVYEAEKEIEKQSLYTVQSIHDVFAELKSLLEQREAELASIATALVEEKKSALEGQKKELQVAATEIQSVVNFAESILENVSDKEMMEQFASLQKQVLDEGKRHLQLKLEPVTTADIVCDLPPVSIIPDNMGSISCDPLILQSSTACAITEQPPKFSQTIKTSESTEFSRPFISYANNPCNVHEESKITLQIGNFKEVTVSDLQSKVYPSSTVTPRVTAKENGIFEIQCTPRVRGRHDLVVKVDGTDIFGSPFQIFASVHPRELKTPVRIIEDLGHPMGITFNHNKQLVVVENGRKRLAILSREGALLRTAISNHAHFKSPRGIAIGPEGTFFVTCNFKGSGCLLKLDYFGHTLKAVLLENPFCVKEICGCFYVCVQGAVEVFDVDCNRTGRLTADRCSQPYDIAAGKDCLYVVSNSSSGVIAEFCLNGRFRKLFREALPRPRCICVDLAGFVYVTLGRGPPRILTFSSSGDLVASFTTQLKPPVGIAIDEDGFLYVCETTQNRVVVF